ncbi:MAG: PAS domain S-box protein [Halobacteriaceae archaeon]
MGRDGWNGESDRSSSGLDAGGLTDAVARASCDVAVAVDRDGRVAYASPGLGELLDCDRAAVVGRDWFDECVPSGALAAVSAAVERMLDGEADRVDGVECPVEGPGGEGRRLDWTAVPIRDAAGGVTGVLFAGSRPDGQGDERPGDGPRELAAPEKRYRTLLRAAPDPVFVADAETGEVLAVNDAATDLLGRGREAIVGCQQTDLHPADQRERCRALFEAHVEAGDVTCCERFDDGDPIEVVTADGDRVPVEISVNVVDRGDRTLAVGQFRDVTGRERRERDLRGFRAAVEQAGHAVLITDTDETIEYVNPAFEEISGYDASEAIGKRPSILQSGAHDDAFYREIWETILSGEVWEGELRNERKDGRQYDIEQTIAPITDGGDIERFVAVNTDITERKERERQLERERNRLDEFATTVAHDLRNPLSVAVANLELATSDGRDGSLSDAMDALERMDAMIDEVLTLSKQGQTVQDPAPVCFDAVVETAWHSVDTTDGRLQVDDDAVGWTLTADEARLCGLFENLFRNAVEHGSTSSRPAADDAVEHGSTGNQPPADDAVEHGDTDVTVRVGRLPERTGFFVADDGPGIPPEDRNRVFESGVTTSADGTGFGLAIVKQIVDAHGWRVDVTTAETGGARFEVVTGGHTREP